LSDNLVSLAIIQPMARKVFVGIRLDPELKKSLEELGHAEERSVSQVCEFLLRKGIDAYKKEGAKYLRKSATKEKQEGSPK
jgi:predicted transcriptional regulator